MYLNFIFLSFQKTSNSDSDSDDDIPLSQLRPVRAARVRKPLPESNGSLRPNFPVNLSI